MIELVNVSKKLQKKWVLKDISITFEPGKIYGIKGKNGAGKTMLLRAISGLINLSSGEIIISGEKLHEDIDFPRSVGILIENSNLLPEYTGIKNLQMLSKIKKVATEEKLIQTLESVGLDPYDKRTVKKYSLGMKQRLSIAQAIFEEPDIILLDEPTNAIDTEGVLAIRKLLINEKQRGATIVIASHSVEDLSELSDEILQMESGRIKYD
ncbi:ABC transporter ATP-binding protein [Listeria monocytogenes]|nr:ABC transporter ATP-binding protein [Listeria monocytogenes]